MHGVNLKLLQTFVCAADQGSFRRASEILKRSPSAISMQIRDLEAQLGIRLFVRAQKKIALTVEGRMLFKQVQGSMADIQACLETLTEMSAKRRGTVSVAFAPTLASTRMGGILTTYRRRFPESTVTITEVSTQAALQLLQDQDAEFYIGPELPNLTDFEFEPLVKDRLFALIPRNLDDGAETVSFADLAAKPVILLDQASATRKLIDDLLTAEGVNLNISYEIQTTFTALRLAADGLGIAIVPQIGLDMADTSECRAVAIRGEHAFRYIGILTARGYVRHGYSEQMLKLIRQEFSTQPYGH